MVHYTASLKLLKTLRKTVVKTTFAYSSFFQIYNWQPLVAGCVHLDVGLV